MSRMTREEAQLEAAEYATEAASTYPNASLEEMAKMMFVVGWNSAERFREAMALN